MRSMLSRNGWRVLFGACLVVLAGSLTGAWVTLDRRAVELRGWEDATRTQAMPERLPLAGVNVDLRQYSAEALPRELERIAAAGFTWVRQPFLWQDIEPQPGEFDWAVYDVIVTAVAAQDGLDLVAVLDGTPPWARHTLAPDHPFAPPASTAAYTDFAGAVAERYQDSITYYQIWDEPNIKLHWGNLDPRPAHYVAMLRGAYTAIHAADADASVIAAALAPTVETGPDNLSDLLFLRAIYDQGGGDYFDAAAGKPYGFDTGPDDRRVSERILNFSRLILLREEMVRRGDGDKPLWGSNFGWNHLADDWQGPPSLWGSATADERLSYTRAAYERARREWPWVGGLILQHWQPDAPPDDPIQGFALAPVIDDWIAAGVNFGTQSMIAGRYPVQNLFTEYSEGWQFSAQGADARVPEPGVAVEAVENRITVQFDGTSLALLLHRDDYLAYLLVTVDGQPANALPRNRQGEAYVVLTAPERRPTTDLITVAQGLSEGIHTAEIVHRPAQGDDRWPIAGYAVGVEPDSAPYEWPLRICVMLGGLALIGGVVSGTRLPWRSIRPPAPDTLRQGSEWLVGLGVSLIVLLGTLLTWGEAIPALLRRDQPALAVTILTAGLASLAPVFVITLVALGVLFVMIYNRPILGVMLVIFWSAFFLSTLDLFFRLFATVEVYLALTVLALSTRAAVDWARQRKGTSGRVMDGQPVAVRLMTIDWLVIAFVAVGLLSLTWAEYRGYAVHELRVVIVEPAAFYFLVRLMRMEQRDLLWLVDALIFTGGAIAVVGLVLFFTGENVVEAEGGARRLISIYGSPNGVGLYLGRCIPFALAYALLAPRGSWRQAFGVSGLGVMAAAVLLSQSRGAILLGIPAALVVGLLVWRGRNAAKAVIALVVGLALALLVLSAVLPRLSDLTGDTAVFRRHLWYSSIQLIREKPLTGVGLDQFLYWYRSRYLLPEAWQEPDLSIPHTLVLNYWVNLGILGVVLGVAFQVWFWRGVWLLRQRIAGTNPLLFALVIGVAGSMADFLGHGLVDVGYFAINLAFVFFLSLALVVHLERIVPQRDESRRSMR